MWVVSVVELSVPTEKTIGPFPTSEEAANYIAQARKSGKWEREQWQRVGTLEMFPPEPTKEREVG